MRKLRLIFILFIAALGCSSAHAVVCKTEAANPSQATVQADLNSCGSGNTLAFVAGSTNVTSQISWPCGVSMAGPVQPYPGRPVTKFVASGYSGNWMGYPECHVSGVAMFAIEWNGGQPSGGGGGGISINYCLSPGTATCYAPAFYGVYFHGFQANPSNLSNYNNDSAIFLNGLEAGGMYNNTGTVVGPTYPKNAWNNLTMKYSWIGNTGDCSNLMSTYSYNGNNYNNAGGFCAGILIESDTIGTDIENTNFYYIEEAIKWLEYGWASGSSGSQRGQVGCSASQIAATPYQFCHASTLIQRNDYSNIHRIAMEAQNTPDGINAFQLEYNSWHDPFYPGYGSFVWSMPQFNGSGATQTNVGTNIDYSVVVSNVNIPSGGSYIPGIEFWGNGHANYNAAWGTSATIVCCTVQWGYGYTGMSIDHTAFYGTGGTPISKEEGDSTYTPPITNSSSGSLAALTSVAPTISPAGGTFTSSQVVTLANPGTNRDKNTGIWYTTDGSTPIPGTSAFYDGFTGGTITLTGAGTHIVKAIGMWGAQNQPTSYPTNYGYVPSAVVTATFTGGSSPVTLTSITVTSASGVNLAPGITSQLTATANYSDGSTTNITTAADSHGNGPAVFSSSNSAVGVVAGAPNNGLYTAGSTASSTNTTAAAGTVTSPALVMTTTFPSLLSGVLSSTTNTIQVGAGTLQITATGNYSDGVHRTLPDSFGNTVIWTSSAPSICTVNSSGLLAPVSAGSCSIQATSSPGGVIFSPWPMTVTAPASTQVPITVTGTTVIITGQNLTITVK